MDLNIVKSIKSRVTVEPLFCGFSIIRIDEKKNFLIFFYVTSENSRVCNKNNTESTMKVIKIKSCKNLYKGIVI